MFTARFMKGREVVYLCMSIHAFYDNSLQCSTYYLRCTSVAFQVYINSDIAFTRLFKNTADPI